MQVAGDPFGPGNLALGLQKHSPYTQALNKAMIKLRSNGEVDMLRRRWLPADYCSEQSVRALHRGLCLCAIMCRDRRSVSRKPWPRVPALGVIDFA